MTGKIPQRRRGNLKQALSQWVIREGLRGFQRRGRKTLTPWLYHSLSPQSFCKSPSLLAALLVPSWHSWELCQRPCTGSDCFWGWIWPQKEYTLFPLRFTLPRCYETDTWVKANPDQRQSLCFFNYYVNDVSSILHTGWWALCAYYVSLSWTQ